MSAFLVAVFKDYATADRVRTSLVADGFPTDRVDLAADGDLGRAALAPGSSPHDKFAHYLRALFEGRDEQRDAERLVTSVDCGAAIIAIHPRGFVETARATQILEAALPSEVVRHDLESQPLEFAAARHNAPWARNLWVENNSHAHCIYCRMSDWFSGHDAVS